MRVRFIFLVLFFILVSGQSFAFEQHEKCSNCSSEGKYQKKIEKLKEYIERGKRLVAKFDEVLDKYELTLNKFSAHRDNCEVTKKHDSSNYRSGSLFDFSDVCEKELTTLVLRLKSQASRLDSLELELIGVKKNIQRAQSGIAAYSTQMEAELSIDEIDGELDRLDDSKKEAERLGASGG